MAWKERAGMCHPPSREVERLEVRNCRSSRQAVTQTVNILVTNLSRTKRCKGMAHVSSREGCVEGGGQTVQAGQWAV